jgi:hypothetical protein
LLIYSSYGTTSCRDEADYRRKLEEMSDDMEDAADDVEDAMEDAADDMENTEMGSEEGA